MCSLHNKWNPEFTEDMFLQMKPRIIKRRIIYEMGELRTQQVLFVRLVSPTPCNYHEKRAYHFIVDVYAYFYAMIHNSWLAWIIEDG